MISEMVLGDYEEVTALWAQTEGIGLDDAVLCGHDGRRGYLHHLAVARSQIERHAAGHFSSGVIPPD